jgi:hypothetical protein
MIPESLIIDVTLRFEQASKDWRGEGGFAQCLSLIRRVSGTKY